MSPAVASDAPVYVAKASDAAVWIAKASDALANSPLVKAVTLSKNPLGYWRLGEAAAPFADSTANGNSLSKIGTVSTQQLGFVAGDPNQRGIAVAAAGAPNYIRNTTSAVFGNRAGALTVAAWIFPTSAPNALNAICRCGQGTDEQYSLFLTSAKKLAYNYSDGAFRQVTGTQIATLNAPNHVALVRSADGVSISLYLNGAVFSGVAISTPTPATNAQIISFLGDATPSQQFNGGGQEIFIAMSALSPADISDLYLVGKTALGALAVASDARI